MAANAVASFSVTFLHRSVLLPTMAIVVVSEEMPYRAASPNQSFKDSKDAREVTSNRTSNPSTSPKNSFLTS